LEKVFLGRPLVSASKTGLDSQVKNMIFLKMIDGIPALSDARSP